MESKLEKKQIADYFVNKENYEKAIEIYTEILGEELDNIDFNFSILSNRSLCWLKLEKYEMALKDCVRCTRIKPKL